MNKLWHLECPSLETPWKCIHVPKPVPNLCMSVYKLGNSLYTRATGLLFGHSLYTRATELLLGHSLYMTWVNYFGTPCAHPVQQAWALLVHDMGTILWYSLCTSCTTSLGIPCTWHGWVLLGYSLCTSCTTSLGTACTPQGYCLDTICTLEEYYLDTPGIHWSYYLDTPGIHWSYCLDTPRAKLAN